MYNTLLIASIASALALPHLKATPPPDVYYSKFNLFPLQNFSTLLQPAFLLQNYLNTTRSAASTTPMSVPQPVSSPLPNGANQSNSSSNMSEPDFRYNCRPHFTPLVVVVTLVYTAIFCSSVIGNSLVIMTIVQNPVMRTPTNMFLLNLAVADLARVLICLPPSIVTIAYKCFLFGEVLCHAISYMQPISVTASAFTLVVIAIERYIAICSPFRSRAWQTRHHSTKMIALVWFLAALLNIPFGVYSVHKMIGPGLYNCRVILPNQMISEAYWTIQVVIMFIVPLVVMTTLYYFMIRTLQQGIRLENLSAFHEMNKSTTSVQENNHHQFSPERHIVLQPFLTPRTSASMEFLAIPHFSLSPVTPASPYKPVSNKALLGSLTFRRMSAAQRSGSKCSAASAMLASPQTSTGRETSNSFQPGSHIELSQSDSKPPGKTTAAPLRASNSERSSRSKRRVIKMLVVIVVEFFICWLPFYSFLLLSAFELLPWVSHPQPMYILFSTFLMLAFLSSCTNPITYCFMNKRFRVVLMQTYCLRACIKSTSRGDGMLEMDSALVVRSKVKKFGNFNFPSNSIGLTTTYQQLARNPAGSSGRRLSKDCHYGQLDNTKNRHRVVQGRSSANPAVVIAEPRSSYL